MTVGVWVPTDETTGAAKRLNRGDSSDLTSTSPETSISRPVPYRSHRTGARARPEPGQCHPLESLPGCTVREHNTLWQSPTAHQMTQSSKLNALLFCVDARLSC